MTLTHDVAGAGPTLVLLHSSVCDRRMWDPQWVALLDAGYRVVRPDFRGFGDTPPGTEPYSDAEDVLELFDTLGVSQAVVIGASFGGRIAQEFAARWPDRVAALALLCAGTPGHTPSPDLLAYAKRQEVLLSAGDVVGAVEFNVETWLGPTADDRARDQLRRMLGHTLDVRLTAGNGAERHTTEVDVASIAVPALVVGAAHDVVDFRDIALDLAERLPGARYVELPWSGHLPALERPAEITALLLDFLAEVLDQQP
ncbi:alpha/beta fold hydrolase [Solihabitans fulvus]|uniref:Alpha/beta fold hydrolase n=1 Tax=Solihabitans fulvus TaxID=1892852 RepID=A0A5B2XUT8_9PSEU|nr:alpha/beta hydrolase [Solihabitans fulvus]KAA2267063.1 alpha/beta fold hydrolase [Solihabitans fulvus]